MKNIVLVIFIACSSFTVNAQVWIDSGAVWHYHSSSPWTVGYSKLVYTKDTLINGQLCQKITREGYTFMYDSDPNIFYQFSSTPAEPKYTSVSNDTVFYLADDGFRILCDFGAQVGDSWLAMIYTNNTGNLDSLVVSVVEIGTLDINNVTFRYVDLQSNSCGNYGYGGRFVERFGFYGSTNFSGLSNFPYVSDCSTIVETFGVGLFCFNDASFHLNGMEGRECEYPYMNFLASSEIDKEVFAVFPNPAFEQVHIVCPNIIHKELAIFDILGQLVAKVTMTSNQFILALNGFESGIYFLKLEDSHYIQKLVIE